MKEKTKNKVAPFNSIAGKLLISVVPMIAISFFIVAGVIFSVAKNVIVGDAQNALVQETRANSQDIGRILANRKGYYSAIADFLSNNEVGGTKEIVSTFKYTSKIYSDMYPGFFGYFEGEKYIDMTGWEPTSDFDPTKRAWYITGSGKNEMTWGVPYLDSTSGGYNVSVSREVTTPSGKKGVIAADLYLKDIGERVSKYRPSGTGRVVLMDDSLTIIASSLKGYVGTSAEKHTENPVTIAIAKELRAGKSGIQIITGDGGQKYYIAIEVIPDTKWTMISYIKEADVISEITKLKYLTVVIVAVMLLLAILLLVFSVRRYITSPVAKLTGNIVSITENDFTVDIQSKGKDEISIMNASMHKFVDNMQKALIQMRNETDKLMELSDNSRKSSENMNTQAQEQSSSMEQISQTMDGISSAVAELAENATELAQMVSDLTDQGQNIGVTMKELVEKADQGQREMVAANHDMEAISASMDDMNNVVKTVEESTKRITGIVEMINSIAEQTNLLSLNASIEAARAGDAGRGFAVVASEIGSLANESANSSQEIGKIIGEVMEQIFSLTTKSSENMEDIQKSTGAVKVAQSAFEELYNNLDQASSTMKNMIKMINTIDDISNSVAAISEEQSASAEEVMATVQNITEAAIEVANESKGAAEMATDVSDAAETIKTFVDTFKLEK
ncbi:methyl-accepting chemotaxis protein [Lachnobacterium bovis]|uniref:Methyl-accepting chemotaxis protein n=2 Tax=Lachnobacterium bovis TaxID=140626 RepID=A0A1H9QYX1_9FIRM|nr:methyl-accepting chemotaxis protein [Lachnobacterium bovis]SER65674.1 methyl-accepting chemotaxis protein [Lachnobacterium bovis]